MGGLMMNQNADGNVILQKNTRDWLDAQVTIVRRYDYVNKIAESWLKELNKEDKLQVSEDTDFSEKSIKSTEENEEQVVSLPVDDCCKRRSHR